jgi:hypothetical protein
VRPPRPSAYSPTALHDRRRSWRQSRLLRQLAARDRERELEEREEDPRERLELVRLRELLERPRVPVRLDERLERLPED